MRTLKQKVDLEPREVAVEGAKIVYLSAESASKTRTLRQKVRFEASKTCTLKQKVRQKRVPSARKCPPNAAPESSRTPPWDSNETGVLLFETSFSRVFGDVPDRTPKRRGVGER